MGKKISIKDIADMAGVSIATVSRIINQNGRYSKTTEECVKKIMKEYDFHPNQLARGLRVNTVMVIGILIPDITNEFFAIITLELQKFLMEYGYLTLICSNNENMQLENEQMDMMLGQRVSGIIYVGGHGATKKIRDIPLICIDRKPVFSDQKLPLSYAFVESDNVKGGMLAAEELFRKKCRKIYVVSYSTKISSYNDRVVGFMSFLQKHNIEPKLRIIEYMNHYNEGENAMQIILKEDPDVDGVFFTTDYLALGGLRALGKQNISVPDKVKVVGYDDISLSINVFPSLTTVRQNVKQMASYAVTNIITLIKGGVVKEPYQKLDVELVVRETT